MAETERRPPRASQPKDLEQRIRAVASVQEGKATVTEAAKQNAISRKTLHKWLRESRATGGKVRAPRTAGRPRATAVHGRAILALVQFAREAVPAARTTTALLTWLAATGGPTYRESTMVRKLREWNFSRGRQDEGDPASPLVWTAPASMPLRVETTADDGPVWLSPRVRAMIADYLVEPHQLGFTIDLLMGELPALRTAMRLKGGTLSELEAHLSACACRRVADRWYKPGTRLDLISGSSACLSADDSVSPRRPAHAASGSKSSSPRRSMRSASKPTISSCARSTTRA
ncbi:transposase [Gemmatimonas sp.]|uniref:transposase n=1 Tax=Gemmatimonas sp. TaxID=1962908 RepID=UPI003DA3FBE3